MTDPQPSPSETEEGSTRNENSLFDQASRSLFLPATLEEAAGRVEERMMDPDYSASYQEVVEDEELPADINLAIGLMATGFQGVVEASSIVGDALTRPPVVPPGRPSPMY